MSNKASFLILKPSSRVHFMHQNYLVSSYQLFTLMQYQTMDTTWVSNAAGLLTPSIPWCDWPTRRIFLGVIHGCFLLLGSSLLTIRIVGEVCGCFGAYTKLALYCSIRTNKYALNSVAKPGSYYVHDDLIPVAIEVQVLTWPDKFVRKCFSAP